MKQIANLSQDAIEEVDEENRLNSASSQTDKNIGND